VPKIRHQLNIRQLFLTEYSFLAETRKSVFGRSLMWRAARGWHVERERTRMDQVVLGMVGQPDRLSGMEDGLVCGLPDEEYKYCRSRLILALRQGILGACKV
jgi:hypothetical protein